MYSSETDRFIDFWQSIFKNHKFIIITFLQNSVNNRVVKERKNKEKVL